VWCGCRELFEYAKDVAVTRGLEGAGRAHNGANRRKLLRFDHEVLIGYLSLSEPAFGKCWRVVERVEKSPRSGFQGGSAGSNPVGATR
jgi:hypothetical protein